MRKAAWSWLVLALAAFSASLVACSDDDDDAGSGTCAVPEGTESSAACEACARGACSSEYAGFCSSGCSTTDRSLKCQQAIGQVAACVLSSCADECASLTGEGGEGASGGGVGTTEPGFACHFEGQGLCSAAEVTESTRDTYEGACVDSGGVIAEICPTDELIGCCSYAGGTQTCVYETTAPALDRDSCGESGGRWGEPE